MSAQLSPPSKAARLAPLPKPEARGLSREEAAAYVGVSPSLFDKMVADHRMPPAKRINTRTVWDRLRLDVAFAALPDVGGGGSDDEEEIEFAV